MSPCDVCKKLHDGPRCEPRDLRTVKISISLPNWLVDAIEARLTTQDTRAGWIRRVVEREIGS